MAVLMIEVLKLGEILVEQNQCVRQDLSHVTASAFSLASRSPTK
jgi:hypothetical protein